MVNYIRNSSISILVKYMSTSVEFITTTKGCPLMVLDGLSYIQDRRTDTKTYWRCENHKTFSCHYHIHTCNNSGWPINSSPFNSSRSIRRVQFVADQFVAYSIRRDQFVA